MHFVTFGVFMSFQTNTYISVYIYNREAKNCFFFYFLHRFSCAVFLPEAEIASLSMGRHATALVVHRAPYDRVLLQ